MAPNNQILYVSSSDIAISVVGIIVISILAWILDASPSLYAILIGIPVGIILVYLQSGGVTNSILTGIITFFIIAAFIHSLFFLNPQTTLVAALSAVGTALVIQLFVYFLW